LLLPLLRAGIDIEGCDISRDMLAFCRSKAAREGFAPRLYQQPMHALAIPRTYKTIYICGSFGLAGSRDNDLATLQCCYAHLERGGALLVNIAAEYTSWESWRVWSSEYRQALPQAWPKDGSENVAYFRYIDINPLEQRYIRQVRVEKWFAGERVASEGYTLRGNMYLQHELLLLLKVAGFRGITVRGDYTDDPATADHQDLVFTAIKTETFRRGGGSPQRQQC
jgi:hypothetical protein